jgi:hypothetical protein
VALSPLQLPEPPRLGFRQRAGTKIAMLLLLVATVVGGAGGLIFIAMGGGPEDTLESVPNPGRIAQRMLMLAFLGVVNAGCSVGMWSFRRWGVYGVVCASLVAFMINWKMGGIPVAVPGLVAVACAAAFAMASWVEFD